MESGDPEIDTGGRGVETIEKVDGMKNMRGNLCGFALAAIVLAACNIHAGSTTVETDTIAYSHPVTMFRFREGGIDTINNGRGFRPVLQYEVKPR